LYREVTDIGGGTFNRSAIEFLRNIHQGRDRRKRSGLRPRTVGSGGRSSFATIVFFTAQRTEADCDPGAELN
jgi:hypothetical protein